MDKKRIIIVSILVVGLVIAGLFGTFASDETLANNSYDIVLTGNNREINVPAGSIKTALYQITNTNKGVVKYGIAYSGTDITVKVYNDSIDPATGNIDYGESKYVKLYIENTGTTNSIVSIQAVLGYEHGGELTPAVPSGYTLVSELYGISEPDTLISHITNLYLNNKDTDLVANNGISYRYSSIYDKDDNDTTSGGLMNDRQGTMDVGEDDGNIRYYGANPNNYIYFNCERYPKTNCETWRIIGLFKDVEVVQADGSRVKQDLIKIARDSTIGNYSWDNKNTSTGADSKYGKNNWTDARLMMLLNGGYSSEATGGSLYWDAKSGSCYAGSENKTTTCDFTSTGLKNDTTRKMIAKAVWSTLGWNNAKIYSNQIYDYERTTGSVYDETTRAKEWEGHVALMYPSDYGYATDFNSCNQNLNYYETAGCYDNDWLYQTSTFQWLLTPHSGGSNDAWRVDSGGFVNDSYIFVNNGVRPVLYLNPELGIESEGDGTSENPYKIKISSDGDSGLDDSTSKTIVSHISNLYMNNKNATPITNNGIEYTYASIYDKDSDDNTSGGLMNDRLGGTTSDYDAGNIRYYGATPSNYIDIGDVYPVDIKNWVEPFQMLGLPEAMLPTTGEECQVFASCSNFVELGLFDDVATCEVELPYMLQSAGYSSVDELCSIIPAGTTKLYRIIGLFKNVEMEDGSKKDLVKVIKDSPIGIMEWDSNRNNNWHTATLQEYLNTGKYFTELSQYVKNNIATVKWNLGSTNSVYMYADQIYGYERGNEKCQDCNYETVWPGKIALMYPSDYGYATNLANCSNTLTNYDENVACYSNDWLSTPKWLLTPNRNSNGGAFAIYTNPGDAPEITSDMTVNSTMNVYPVFYLNSELSIESGDGTETNPYRININ